MRRNVVVGMLSMVLFAVQPALAAPNVGFGDDGGEYSNDGECDDPRFDGPGMTATALLGDDVLRDATDCKAAFDDGRLTLRGVAADGTIDFGDDGSNYANDGECDDLRFVGPGMTTTGLIGDDLLHDATDCTAAYGAGTIKLRLK